MQNKSESFKNPLYFSMEAWGVVEEKYYIQECREEITFEKKKLLFANGEPLNIPIKYFLAKLVNSALGRKIEFKLNDISVECILKEHHVSVFEQFSEENNFNKYHYTAEFLSRNNDESLDERYSLHVYFPSKHSMPPLVKLRNAQKLVQTISETDKKMFFELAREMTCSVMFVHEGILADNINTLRARQNNLLEYNESGQLNNPTRLEEAQLVVEGIERLIKYGVSSGLFSLSAIKNYITLFEIMSRMVPSTVIERDKSVPAPSFFSPNHKSSGHKKAKKISSGSRKHENLKLTDELIMQEINHCIAQSLERLRLGHAQLKGLENIISLRTSIYQELQYLRRLCKFGSSMSESDEAFINQCDADIKKEFMNTYPLLFIKTDDDFINMDTGENQKLLAELWLREMGNDCDYVEAILKFCVQHNFSKKIKFILEKTGFILSEEQNIELYTVIIDNDYFECFKSLIDTPGNPPMISINPSEKNNKYIQLMWDKGSESRLNEQRNVNNKNRAMLEDTINSLSLKGDYNEIIQHNRELKLLHKQAMLIEVVELMSNLQK